MVGAGEPGYSRVNRLPSASSITTESRAALVSQPLLPLFPSNKHPYRAGFRQFR